MSVVIHHGDSWEVLKGIPDGSVDSCCTDAPYALVATLKRFGADNAAPVKAGKTGVYKRSAAGFMGKRWDTGEAAHNPAFWAEVLRVLKPGAHLIAFSGTRTQHRQVCAIEDAGFEIRDTVLDLIASDTLAMTFFASLTDEQQGAFARVVEEAGIGGMLAWCFGSGFPKSHNQTGAHEGWGSALKPAFEPICLARKPMIGTIAQNLAAFGTGALNIDGCRVGTADDLNGGAYTEGRQPRAMAPGGAARSAQPGAYSPPAGRWPANAVHDGSDEVIAAFPESDGAQGRVTGREPSTGERYILSGLAGNHAPREPRADSASRFFYTAKADATDRLGSKHPTVKPTDLMRWLVRLVTPPGGTVLDPFAGSGSTGVACIAEGFDAILIEREAEYVADIRRRIAWAQGEGRLTAQEMAKAPDLTHDDLPLFGGQAA
ncbi:DNA-methyltransferase [Phenylobacterium sp.]|uniref:DNA-methyltransferase n=1 Tax=Phenylobacterium sp. TaxID=1871053 RepID=UPI002FC7B59B